MRWAGEICAAMTPRRKLVGVMIASALVGCITAIGAIYLATHRYYQAARDSQIERASYVINQYVNETVWRSFAANVGDLDSGFRCAAPE